MAVGFIVGLLPDVVNALLHAFLSTALAQAFSGTGGAFQVEVSNLSWLAPESLSMSLNVFAEGVIPLEDLVDHVDHVVSNELLVYSLKLTLKVRKGIVHFLLEFAVLLSATSLTAPCFLRQVRCLIERGNSAYSDEVNR